MRQDFKRKLTRNEFDNLIKELNTLFKPKSIKEIFEYFMEHGTYTWDKGKFTNKIGLLYKTHSDIILHKANNKPEDLAILEDIINYDQGTEKHYFLYINCNKCPQMWRLEDMKCVWGVGVHESYTPLQGVYSEMFREIKERQRKEKEKQEQEELNKFFSQYVEG